MSESEEIKNISNDIAVNLTGLVDIVTEDDEELRRDCILFLRAVSTALALVSTAVKTSIFRGVVKKMLHKAIVTGRARLESLIAEKLQKFL